jgi:hypothetical protein
MRRLAALSLTILVLDGCSQVDRNDVKKPQRLTSTLCDAIGLDNLHKLVPDGKVEQFLGADDSLVDDLADAGCNVSADDDGAWGGVQLLVRRAGQTTFYTPRELAESLVESDCKRIEAPAWKDEMAKHYPNFVAGPPVRPTGVGDEACMITSEHTVIDDRVADVRIYARRGSDFVQMEYSWSDGDITAMSAKAVELTTAIFNAKLS